MDNNSEENLVCILNNHNRNNNELMSETNHTNERPELPSRDVIFDKPLVPLKPNALNYNLSNSMSSTACPTSIDSSLYCESHPIYANSSEIFNDELNVACSEGSITPTNPERCGSPYSEVYSQNRSASFSSSTLAIPRSGKPAPPPPLRRTSTLSNPNAITFGTLKSAGVNTYEEIQSLNRTYSTYEDINSLAVSLQNISTIGGQTMNEPIYNRCSEIYTNSSCVSNQNSTSNTNIHKNLEYQSAKNVFESVSNRGSQVMAAPHVPEEESTSLPLPAPPPEAFSDSEASHGHHYNKITNVHRQFLETLNSKLGQSPQSQHSPRLIKRRSMSLTHSHEDDWNSDSAVANRSTSQTHSIQQTLKMLMTGNHSRSSSSSSTSSARHRRQSPDTSRKKASFTLASCDRESLMASLNMRLAQRQQHEIAKAVAANAMQTKQSVPDLKDMTQNQQIYSSSLVNSANIQQSHQIYQPIAQHIQMRNSNSDDRRNEIYQQIGQHLQQPQQQQIYGPVLHQQQLQRRSSQPTMGIKLTTSRQQVYESVDKQGFKSNLNSKLNSAQTGQQIQQQSHYQSFSTDNYANSRHNNKSALPSDSNNKDNSKAICNSSEVKCKDKPKSGKTSRTHSNQDSFESAVAARVHSWFNSVQLPPELMLCRESLMDQIRRGKQLRKVTTSSDRSAPKLA